MADGTGLKPRWASPVDSDNWMDIFSLAKAAADELALVKGWTGRDASGNPKMIVEAIHTASAVTLASFNAFPVGSTIECVGTTPKTINKKTGATSWVSVSLS